MKTAIKKHFLKLSSIVFLLLFLTYASAISYTVQVIALSSESNVNILKDRLLKLGFPAYVISVPTNQGHIYRLRVGSFADRDTALKYADAMQGVLDSLPVPQLAEGIPDDLVLLEPKSLNSYESKDILFSVKPWQDTFLIRIQSLGSFKEADYYLAEVSFKAFRVSSTDDNKLVRVYKRPLWPKVYPIDSTAERDAFYSKVVTELSPKLGITTDEIKKYQFLNTDDEPFLVLVEEYDLKTGQASIQKALGDPSSNINQYGPKLTWFDDSQKIDIEESKSVFELSYPIESKKEEFMGSNWTATQSSVFTDISVEEGKKHWLALAGQPVWAKDDYLLTLFKNKLTLYRLK